MSCLTSRRRGLRFHLRGLRQSRLTWSETSCWCPCGPNRGTDMRWSTQDTRSRRIFSTIAWSTWRNTSEQFDRMAWMAGWPLHCSHTYRQNRKHHLGNIKCMPPIVVSNVTVVLLHAQQPSAQHFVFNVKSFNEIKFQKYSQTRLKNHFPNYSTENWFAISYGVCALAGNSVPAVYHRHPCECHQIWNRAIENKLPTGFSASGNEFQID